MLQESVYSATVWRETTQGTGFIAFRQEHCQAQSHEWENTCTQGTCVAMAIWSPVGHRLLRINRFRFAYMPTSIHQRTATQAGQAFVSGYVRERLLWCAINERVKPHARHYELLFIHDSYLALIRFGWKFTYDEKTVRRFTARKHSPQKTQPEFSISVGAERDTWNPCATDGFRSRDSAIYHSLTFRPEKWLIDQHLQKETQSESSSFN